MSVAIISEKVLVSKQVSKGRYSQYSAHLQDTLIRNSVVGMKHLFGKISDPISLDKYICLPFLVFVSILHE